MDDFVLYVGIGNLIYSLLFQCRGGQDEVQES